MKSYILIFGSQGNLGKGITKVLAEKEFTKIYLFDRHFSRIKSPNNQIVQIKVKDLMNEEDVISAFNNITIDQKADYHLISTIGMFMGGKTITDTKYDDWLRVHSTNLNISFLIAKHFSKLVKAAKGGSIWLTSAITSLNPEEGKAAYGSSKNSLNYLVKTLAKEGRKINLSSNAIAPFIIDTKQNREWISDKTLMVSPKSIGNLLYSLIKNYKILSGNVFELPGTLK